MLDLTAIILTKNEEKNIVACLSSIKDFVNRIVVVDSGSVDKTIDICKNYNAEIFSHDFEYTSKQFNWALENCNLTSKWILKLDADESLDEKLKAEVEEVLKKADKENINALSLSADLFFLGRKLKHGLTKKKKVMFFKNGFGRLEDRRRDAHFIISGGITYTLKSHYIHNNIRSVSDFIEKYNAYAEREALDYLDFKEGKNYLIEGDKYIAKTRKKKFGFYYKLPKFFRARLFYIYGYIFKGGFLDGKEGKMYFYLEYYWYRFLVDTKICEKQKEVKNNNQK